MAADILKTVRVSVIIPVYNVEKYLRECLDSVVNQTLREIEIICVDDGSTDGSSAILAEYAAKDPRVKVITRPHTNAGAARNAGMAIATGEYLGFVDSDDWCELTLFEKAYEKAEKNAAEVVFWRFVLCDAVSGNRMNEGLFSAEYKRETALIDYNLAPWSRLVKRDFILREKLAFQEIARSNDVYFGGMVMMLACKAAVLDEVLYSYRTGRSSSLQSSNANTPCIVIDAWTRLIEEWRSRKIAVSDRIIYSAAFASLFYTLESIHDAEAYKLLWQRLKSFGADLKAKGDVRFSNDRLVGLWSDLWNAETPLDYLVRRQKVNANVISVLWHKLYSCEGELKSSQKARRINWEDAQRLSRELAETKAVVESVRAELESSQKARRINWEDVQRLNRELTETKAVVESVRAELESSQKARRINWEDAQRLGKELNASEAARNVLERELDAVGRKLLHDRDENQRLNRALALSHDKLASCKERMMAEKARAHGLEDQVARCRVEVLSTRSDMRRALDNLNSCRAELSACRREMEAEILKRDHRIAEFESSWLCRYALKVVKRMNGRNNESL